MKIEDKTAYKAVKTDIARGKTRGEIKKKYKIGNTKYHTIRQSASFNGYKTATHQQTLERGCRSGGYKIRQTEREIEKVMDKPVDAAPHEDHKPYAQSTESLTNVQAGVLFVVAVIVIASLLFIANGGF